jgi:hypothetical protein
MRKILVLVLVLYLAACASVSEVKTGENKLGDRLKVTLDGPWNQINAPNIGPAQLWTTEGITIDELLIYTGLKDGEAVHAKNSHSDAKNFVFRSTMEPSEIVGLFEGMLTRDTSTFKLTKLEPNNFGGRKGFHFEYSLIRKGDNVPLSGMGYGTVSKGELFAVVYQAPRLTFFPRHKATIEKLASSAVVIE